VTSGDAAEAQRRCNLVVFLACGGYSSRANLGHAGIVTVSGLSELLWAHALVGEGAGEGLADGHGEWVGLR
jgi:hypothetical protein